MFKVQLDNALINVLKSSSPKKAGCLKKSLKVCILNLLFIKENNPLY